MFADLLNSMTDISVFTNSVSDFFKNFGVSSVVMSILAVFMLVGLIDKLRGNKLGYGERFDAGFHAMGDLALAIVGIISISPVLLKMILPLVSPLYDLIGASPAMFPGSLLALDMGGYALSVQMAGDNAAIGNLSGIIVASMMGITFCFTIPYALTVLKKEDHKLFAMGILLGIVTLPIGCLLGGLVMGMTSTPIGFHELIVNLLPVFILAIVVAVGLALKQQWMLKIFSAFGKAMTFIATVSPGIAIFQYLTGLRFPLFHLMVEENEALGGAPLEVGLLLVGLIAIVLVGAFPMILFLNRRLGGMISKFGKRAGINTEASTGLLTQLASSIPIWSVINDMNNRGKLINIAFAVSGSFVLGDVLAFTGGANPEMVFPVIVAKLSGGGLAIALTLFLLKKGKIKAE
ncbi:ethanolamine utilization protein EutH [Christensenellaceae bacterium OttesenSCG-928-M15]|nr:ethanolamine utilization protein EutH [Christensenellaceae bacterium OttesenSCG-928-M15]